MKIVTKLKIFGVFAIFLVAIIGIVTYWRSVQVSLAIERERTAREIVREAFILNILSGDYIHTRGERAEIQWRAQHKHLFESIKAYKIESSDEKQIIDELTTGQQEIFANFTKLQESISMQESIILDLQANASASATASLAKNLENRLIGQLSVDMQKIVASASRLSDINNIRFTSIRDATYNILISTIFILGVSLVFIYFLLARNISRSIKRLIEGTKKLAGGDLSFRYDLKNKDEFGQLAGAFNTMAASLEKLDEIKTEFIYLVSHELRTPVGTIKGFLSMINEGDYGSVNKKMERPMILIADSVDRLLHIVNNMLHASGLQAGKIALKYSDYDLGNLINEAVNSIKPLADQKNIILAIEKSDSLTVHADKEKVSEILNNLLDNAVKFTDAGKITISSEQKNNMAFVIVSDTGIGIPEEYRQKLFDKFDEIKLKQAGLRSGIGLGLYISREFARKMNGDLWIEKSEVGKGSTFVFSLTLADI